MTKKQKVILGIIVLIIGAVVYYFVFGKDAKEQSINISGKDLAEQTEPVNQGNVSPITGIACENWNRRPIAVMQPGDVTARPASGFSEADMVFEMPVITASITRLMAVYGCNTPSAAGSMRSARHDFIHLAKGLDAIFVSWGRSESHEPGDPTGLAKGILERGEIDNINCNGDAGKSANACPVNPCYRNESIGRGVDSGYGDPAKFFQCGKDFSYGQEWRFPGYMHEPEAEFDKRGVSKRLRVAYGGPYEVEYVYNREKNNYERIWGNTPDTDRNNQQRVAPKNVAVLMALSEQIEGQYNNVQLGDPWYDHTDSGEAYYYMNGEEKKGSWKKDKSKINSKLFFLDEQGKEIKFVPGQIWVNILEPGQTRSWQ
jgi:hypothetical protein